MERIQKILARAGLGSRRACEELIAQGRVTVDGRTVGLGEKADEQKDHIAVDGKRVNPPELLVYIALHKPRNVISAVTSPDPRPTVRDLVPVPGRLFPVGRLDIESEGLILLTNDGELTNQLTHPRYGADKEYRVLVSHPPDQAQLETWQRGVVLEDGHKTLPAKVRIESEGPRGVWLRVTMHEGRKRQIREVGHTLGLPVLRIIRIRIGSLYLGALKPREWRELTPEEIAALKATTPRDRKPPPSQKPRTPTDRAAPRARQTPSGRRGPAGSRTPRVRQAPLERRGPAGTARPPRKRGPRQEK